MIQVPEVDLSQFRVLLFHSKGWHSKSLLTNLRSCGLTNVVVTEKLSAAIGAVISQKLDLILVTHFGEAETTTLLLEELKSHGATADIPVVGITEEGDVKHFLRILAKGVDEVLVEPLSQVELEEKLKRVFTEREAVEAGEEAIRFAHGLIDQGQLEEAEFTFKAFLDSERYRLRAMFGLYRSACKKERWEEAEKILRSALDMARSEPDRIIQQRAVAEVFFFYGDYYTRRLQLKKAAKSYRVAFGLNPFHLDNMRAYLKLLQQEDDFQAIIGVIHEATSNYLPYSQPLETVALTVSEVCDRFLSIGLVDRARALYRELLTIRHENTEVLTKTADFLLDSGEKRLAVQGLAKMSGRIKDPDLLAKLGGILLEAEDDILAGEADQPLSEDEGAPVVSKRLAMARQSFHQAMLLNPDDTEFRLGLARCELQLGRPEEAETVLQRIRERDPDESSEYIGVIEALMAEHADDMAHAWLKEAIRKWPHDAAVAKAFARYHRGKGQHYEAIARLKQGLAKRPDDAEMVLMLAESYLEAKEHSDAIYYFEQAGKMLPDDPRVQEGLRSAIAGR